jgi:plasmid stability protein
MHAGGKSMNQITVRRLDSSVIEKLKTRAAKAGRSMEEEVRTILTDAVEQEQLARQRAWVEEMRKTHKRLFGDRVFPDSSGEFRKMRDERTRQIEEWALPKKKK